MAVGPLDEDGLAVDKQLAVFDFHFAEAHTPGDGFDHFIPLLEAYAQRI